jgi:hypothetical protein
MYDAFAIVNDSLTSKMEHNASSAGISSGQTAVMAGFAANVARLLLQLRCFASFAVVKSATG